MTDASQKHTTDLDPEETIDEIRRLAPANNISPLVAEFMARGIRNNFANGHWKQTSPLCHKFIRKWRDDYEKLDKLSAVEPAPLSIEYQQAKKQHLDQLMDLFFKPSNGFGSFELEHEIQSSISAWQRLKHMESGHYQRHGTKEMRCNLNSTNDVLIERALMLIEDKLTLYAQKNVAELAPAMSKAGVPDYMSAGMMVDQLVQEVYAPVLQNIFSALPKPAATLAR